MEEDTLKDEEMEHVCGIDVSYVKNTANCSRLLIMKRRSWQVIDAANMSIRSTEHIFRRRL
jgi:hypothetical protein